MSYMRSIYVKFIGLYLDSDVANLWRWRTSTIWDTRPSLQRLEKRYYSQLCLPFPARNKSPISSASLSSWSYLTWAFVRDEGP
jgi:hypothetical protein